MTFCTAESPTMTLQIAGQRYGMTSAAAGPLFVALAAACSEPSPVEGLIVPYDGESNQMFEKELFHPSTPKSSATSSNTQYLDPFDAQASRAITG